MWCAYAFTALALVSLPDAIHAGRGALVDLPLGARQSRQCQLSQLGRGEVALSAEVDHLRPAPRPTGLLTRQRRDARACSATSVPPDSATP